MSHQLSFTHLLLYDPGKEGISIDVTMLLNSKSVTVEAKIDTGASYCVFQRQHGESLGMDIESGVPMHFRTVTGSFLAYGHGLTLSTLAGRFDTMIYFAAVEDFSRNILGRRGWLDRIKMALIDYDGKLFLSPYDEQ